jgi:hypothetical protein
MVIESFVMAIIGVGWKRKSERSCLVERKDPPPRLWAEKLVFKK